MLNAVRPIVTTRIGAWLCCARDSSYECRLYRIKANLSIFSQRTVTFSVVATPEANRWRLRAAMRPRHTAPNRFGGLNRYLSLKSAITPRASQIVARRHRAKRLERACVLSIISHPYLPLINFVRTQSAGRRRTP